MSPESRSSIKKKAINEKALTASKFTKRENSYKRLLPLILQNNIKSYKQSTLLLRIVSGMINALI